MTCTRGTNLFNLHNLCKLFILFFFLTTIQQEWRFSEFFQSRAKGNSCLQTHLKHPHMNCIDIFGMTASVKNEKKKSDSEAEPVSKHSEKHIYTTRNLSSGAGGARPTTTEAEAWPPPTPFWLPQSGRGPKPKGCSLLIQTACRETEMTELDGSSSLFSKLREWIGPWC